MWQTGHYSVSTKGLFIIELNNLKHSQYTLQLRTQQPQAQSKATHGLYRLFIPTQTLITLQPIHQRELNNSKHLDRTETNNELGGQSRWSN